MTIEEKREALEEFCASSNCETCVLLRWTDCGFCHFTEPEVNRACNLVFGDDEVKALKAEIERLEREMEAIKDDREASIRFAHDDGAREFAYRLKERIASMEYKARTARRSIGVDDLRAQMDWMLHEIFPQAVDTVLQTMTKEGGTEG